jgi:hydrogenase maturation protein HypF
MAEHGRTGAVVGISLDGAGFGPDGTVWGGEILVCRTDGFSRAGRLSLRRMPGGDAASREPWRMALAVLYELARSDSSGVRLPSADEWKTLGAVEPAAKRAVLAMIERDIRCVRTSSAGRVFDAAAAILGICLYNRYEGQAPCMLQEAAELCAETCGIDALDLDVSPDDRRPSYRYRIIETVGGRGGEYAPRVEIETGQLFLDLVSDMEAGRHAGAAALAFHRGLAAAVCEAAARTAREEKTDTIALGGGCFHNSLLCALCVRILGRMGFNVLVPRLVPAGDGGISLGQAFLALRSVVR